MRRALSGKSFVTQRFESAEPGHGVRAGDLPDPDAGRIDGHSQHHKGRAGVGVRYAGAAGAELRQCL